LGGDLQFSYINSVNIPLVGNVISYSQGNNVSVNNSLLNTINIVNLGL